MIHGATIFEAQRSSHAAILPQPRSKINLDYQVPRPDPFTIVFPGALFPLDSRTDDEKAFWRFVNTRGTFNVSDKRKFLDNLDRWQTFKVRQE